MNANHNDHTKHMNHSSHASHANHAGHGEHSRHTAHSGPPDPMGHANHENHTGHEEHSSHSGHMGNLGRLFFISLVLAVPILLLSPMMGVSLPWQISFPGSVYLVPVLATALFFYGGMPFLKGAVMELKEGKPAMMTLISLGISVSYLYSLYAFGVNHLWGRHGAHVMDFFWELASLIVIMLLGHWVEMRAVAAAGSALESMAALLPGSALVIGNDGRTDEVPLSDVPTGAKVRVRAGDAVPADGVIIDGRTSVNESMLTGEARAVEKGPGDAVIGGSVNGSGVIVVRVTATGREGYLSQVMRLVQEAQQSKSKTETLSNRVAGWLFYVALAAGILAFLAWQGVTGNTGLALERMVTVLIIACPHALGLAIPLVMARSTSLAAKTACSSATSRPLRPPPAPTR